MVLPLPLRSVKERQFHAIIKLRYTLLVLHHLPHSHLSVIFHFALTLYQLSYRQAHQCQDLKKNKNHTGKVQVWNVHVKFKFLKILLSILFTQTK